MLRSAAACAYTAADSGPRRVNSRLISGYAWSARALFSGISCSDRSVGFPAAAARRRTPHPSTEVLWRSAFATLVTPLAVFVTSAPHASSQTPSVDPDPMLHLRLPARTSPSPFHTHRMAPKLRHTAQLTPTHDGRDFLSAGLSGRSAAQAFGGGAENELVSSRGRRGSERRRGMTPGDRPRSQAARPNERHRGRLPPGAVAARVANRRRAKARGSCICKGIRPGEGEGS